MIHRQPRREHSKTRDDGASRSLQIRRPKYRRSNRGIRFAAPRSRRDGGDVPRAPAYATITGDMDAVSGRAGSGIGKGNRRSDSAWRLADAGYDIRHHQHDFVAFGADGRPALEARTFVNGPIRQDGGVWLRSENGSGTRSIAMPLRGNNSNRAHLDGHEPHLPDNLVSGRWPADL